MVDGGVLFLISEIYADVLLYGHPNVRGHCVEARRGTVTPPLDSCPSRADTWVLVIGGDIVRAYTLP